MWFRRWGRTHLKAVNLGYKARSIPDCSDTLDKEIAGVLARTGGHQVDLIGHSMGGLVILAYLKRPGNNSKVRNAVLLGSPNSGSKMAVFGPSPLARQMRPGSAFIRDLDVAELCTRSGARLYSIYSVLDNVVLPNESCRLPGKLATTIETAPVDHLGLLFNKTTARLVYGCLENDD
jgi:pimeloyl-ACP methyl ester carboxylesterase